MMSLPTRSLRLQSLRLLSSVLRQPLPPPALPFQTARLSSTSTAHDPSPSSHTPSLTGTHTRTHTQAPPQSSPSPPSSTSTVSSSETTHFSALSSSWWDPHGPSRLLHLMNPLRHTFLQTLQNPSTPPPTTYLDIGCGGGIFTSSAARLPSTTSVLGIDPTPACIRVAKAHQRTDPALQEPKLRYLNTAIENLGTEHLPSSGPAGAAAKAGFDVVSIFEVLEHVEQASLFLGECASRVRPGGWLVGSTIARSWPAWLTAVVVAEAPVVGVVPRGTHTWERFVLPDEVRGWFEKRGRGKGEEWGEVRVQGVLYVPGLGWKSVPDGLGGENWGNYFFGVQRLR